MEIEAEVEDLEPDQQAELVALMWVGRGDMEPEEWEDALGLAAERRDGSTAAYLLKHPHVADHMIEGLDKLFDGSDLMEIGRVLRSGTRHHPSASISAAAADGLRSFAPLMT